MRTIAYISVVLIALGLSACSSSSALSQGLESSSIISLRSIETNDRSMLISQNIILEGQVTANDRYGEFSSSIIVEDQSGAVKILCDVDQIYKLYPFGCSVQINCNGLYLNNQYGSLKLGAMPTGDYTLDYIDSSSVGQYVKYLDSTLDAPTPKEVTLSELTILDIYTLVQLQGATITNPDGVTTFCDRDPDTSRTIDTYHTITDNKGDTTTLFVDRLCTYADRELPTQPVTVQAIVDYYDSCFSLTICNFGIAGN